MGLPIGCYNTADQAFGEKHGLKLKVINDGKSVEFRSSIDIAFILLSEINGDCTAASLHTEGCTWTNLLKYLPCLIEYLSLNGRISCFFSRKVREADVEDCLVALKKFPFMGLHVQKSNRDPDKDTYMITGLLKVPNPYINCYAKWNGEDYSHHNHLDSSKFNEVNQKYNLPTL